MQLPDTVHVVSLPRLAVAQERGLGQEPPATKTLALPYHVLFSKVVPIPAHLYVREGIYYT